MANSYALPEKSALTKTDPLGYCFAKMSELLAKRLKAWRGGLRQKEAAALLDIPLPTYRKYEAGKRHPNKLALPELDRRMQAKP